MKFKCNNCMRETDLDAGDILQMGHPICCDEDMEIADEKPDPPITTDDGFDQFLDDATHAVHNMWCARGGSECGSGELYALNDAITAFFSGKKRG